MLKISAFLSAAALGLMFASSAQAGPLDDIVNARQACMKANGKAMGGTLVPIVKGGAYDAAAVQTAIASIEAACGGWAGWWAPEATAGETVTSRAKPEIWTDKAGFDAAGAAYGAALTALKATTDEAGFKAAFGAFGGACQGCHEKYQAPKS
jgi:cytochrome c556